MLLIGDEIPSSCDILSNELRLDDDEFKLSAERSCLTLDVASQAVSFSSSNPIEFDILKALFGWNRADFETFSLLSV